VRKMHSVVVAGFGLALLLNGSPAFPRAIDGVVALVNEEPVTFSEVREEVAEGMGIPVGDADGLLREERDPAAVLHWINELVETVLVRTELTRQGQAVTEAEVDRAVESVRKANGVDEQQFKDLLLKEGLSLSAYRRRIRWQMERGAIVRARKFKDVTVTEVEVRDYYTENAERFLVGGQVRLETLFFPVSTENPSAETAARARFAAQQAVDAVRAGKTVAEACDVARATFPEVRLVSGDFLPADDLLPEMQKEVSRLRTGETSQPFFAETGIFVVRVAARRGGTPRDFSQVKAALTEELTDKRSEKAFADILDELKKSASIDVRL
jgi:peptidyl-prolyl cis-trans isomerase SurA